MNNNQTSLSACEVDFLKQGIKRNMRIDGRKRLDFRQIGIDFDPLACASGSCRLILGSGNNGTDLLASVRIDLGTPSRHPISEQLTSRVECTVECAQSALESLDKSLNPLEITNELGQWLTRVLSTPGTLPLTSPELVLNPDKCWIICIDVMILGFRGNLYDAVLMATRCALSRTTIPRIARVGSEDDIELDGDSSSWTPLHVSHVPLSITFNKIGLVYLIDASLSEELISDAKINVIVNANGSVLAVHKSLGGALATSLIIDMLQSSSKIAKQLFSAVDSFSSRNREINLNVAEEYEDYDKDKNSFLLSGF